MTKGTEQHHLPLAGLRDHLATLTGNRKFADDFFDKYVEGREAPDYAHLLALAGYTLRSAQPGRGWVGNVAMAQTPAGLAVGGGVRPAPVPFDTPLYDAGIDSGDVIAAIDDQPATMAAWTAIGNMKSGDTIKVLVMRRGGATFATTITVKQDPTVQGVVTVESTPGGTLTDAQKTFRNVWLATRVN